MSKQSDKPAPAGEMDRLQTIRAELVARLGNQERDASDLTKTTDAIVDARTKLAAIRGTIGDIDRAIMVEQDRLTRQKIEDIGRRYAVLCQALEAEHGGFSARDNMAQGYFSERSPAMTAAEALKRAEFMKAYMIERQKVDAENYQILSLVTEQASLRESLRG